MNENMKDRLQSILDEAMQSIQQSDALDKLNDVRVSFLGKKGKLTSVLKGMKDVAAEERPIVGQMVNDARQTIEQHLEETKKRLEKAIRERQMEEETIDVTLPARRASVGHRHPNTIALEEMERIFIGMGYEVVEGPEIEYDLYNFEKLNIPANHPAKDEQDTFYINKDIVLRTQTSPVQARVMEQGKLPIRMISPGRVFRSDEVDATHSPSFHQIEGLVVDKNITFADLKGTLEQLPRNCSGRRPRPSSVLTISRSQSPAPRWMFPALNAAERDAVSVRDPAGSRSWDAAWCIPMCSRCAVSTRKCTPDLLSAWGWSVSRC